MTNKSIDKYTLFVYFCLKLYVMKFEKLEHLKDYLSSKGVSASEIIDKIGVSRSVFYKIINGEDTRISEQAVITKITTAFKGAIDL